MRLPFRRRGLAAALAVLQALVLLAPVPQARAWDGLDPQLARSSPVVSDATIELLRSPTGSGNAVLRLRFADRRSGGSLVVQGGPGPTPLRDDGSSPDDRAGDGRYAAFVNLNVAEFTRQQQRRVEMARTVKEVPLFDKLREQRGYVPYNASPGLATLQPGIAQQLDHFRGLTHGVNIGRELMITNVLVVDDPQRTYDPCTGVGTKMGPWTFGRLMTEMANEPLTGIHPSDLVLHWLKQWQTEQTINGFKVWPRVGAQRLIDAWPRLHNGKLDLAQAPFRLLAIVNRLDLRGSAFFGAEDAGEARLVFGALNCGNIEQTHPPLPEAMGFMVIFEYGIRKDSCAAVRSWAQQWRALGSWVPGSAGYNGALQAITDQFTLRDAEPARPNGSAINQVRTNENALHGQPLPDHWELRESVLHPRGLLEHSSVAQTPEVDPWVSPVVPQYINQHESSILDGQHVVPLKYPGSHSFRGGSANAVTPSFWNPPGVANLEARHGFSLATCNACHKRETGTEFVHIAPRLAGAPSQLSDFLTGANMPKTDPVSGVPRTFNELLDRAQRLDHAATMSCVLASDLPVEDVFYVPNGPAFAH